MQPVKKEVKKRQQSETPKQSLAPCMHPVTKVFAELFSKSDSPKGRRRHKKNKERGLKKVTDMLSL
jgi:hypothetical protein